MNINILPNTVPGKWSAGFVAAFFLLLALARILVALGLAGGDAFFSNRL